MLKKLLVLFLLLLLTACGSEDEEEETTSNATEAAPASTAVAAAAPAVCEEDTLGCTMIPAGETIKLAIAAPLTGDSASIGLSFSQATQIAVQVANQTPIEGFQFAQLDENDEGTADGGKAAAERIVAVQPTGVVAVVGHAFSGASREAIPVYEAAGIPMMSPSATNPALTQNGSQVFNRVIFNDNAQGDLAARYLYQVLNVRKLAILHDDSIYSQGLAGVAQDRFTELGGEVVIFQEIAPDLTDYTEALAPVAEAAPEAIFFPGYTPEFSAVINSLEGANLSDVIFIGSDGVNTQTMIELTGDRSEGLYLTGEAEPEPSAEKDAFDALYEETFGVDPGTTSRATWAAYDAANVLIAAVRQVALAGEDGNLYIPRQALIEAVRNTRDYAGVSGVVTCNDTGECNSTGPDISVIQNGEGVTVPLTALD